MFSEDQYLKRQFDLHLDKKKEESRTFSTHISEKKETPETNKISPELSNNRKISSFLIKPNTKPNTTKNNLNVTFTRSSLLQKELLEKRKKVERIQKVVEKTRIRFKNRNLGDLKEEKFNKNFKALKNIDTFIDVRDVLQKINLMNDKFSTQPRKTLHNIIIQQTTEEKSQSSDSEEEEEEEIDYNDEELEFNGIRKFRKAKFEVDKRVLEVLYNFKVHLKKRSQIYEPGKKNTDSLQSRMSKHLRNKAFTSEGGIVVDRDGTIKFERKLLDYISQNDKSPMLPPAGFSSQNPNCRNSLKQQLELNFLEKLAPEKKDESKLKNKLEKSSYYEKYKKQSDKVLKLLRKKTKSIYDKKFQIKLKTNVSLSSIVNKSNVNSPSLPKIPHSALKQNKKSSDGMSRVSFSVNIFPTEINSPQSSILNSPFSREEKSKIITKAPLKKKNKIILNEKFLNLITDIDEAQKINSASKPDLISKIETAKREINTSLQNIKGNLSGIDDNLFGLLNKNLKNPALIRSRMRKSIAAMGGGGSIRSFDKISINGIL